MNILGLKIEECCAASLIINGEIIAACSEERFVRKKNYSGFPKQSIEYCLSVAKLDVKDIDLIAIESLHNSIDGIIYSYVQRRSSFLMKDYIKEQKEYWYPILYEGKDIDYFDIFSNKIDKNTFPENFYDYFLEKRKKCKNWDTNTCQEVKRYLIKLYYPEIDDNKIIFVPHHDAHAFYAYYSSPFFNKNKEVLVITADSFGDFENGVIYKFNNNKFKILYTVNNNNIGKIYRNITCLLGMKPYEHEYKVMGLAPYASKYYSDPAYLIFDDTMEVKDLNFFYKSKPLDSYFWFKDKLEGMRFDGIASGLQRYVEDRMCKWIKNAIEKFKIKDIIFAGGIAMNIKLNMMISKLKEVDSLFVPASPDDSTNCIGSCFYVSYNYDCNYKIKILKNMYLGNDIPNRDEIFKKIQKTNIKNSCKIIIDISNKEIAQKLSQGIVIGRCSGRMEFGARSLGNRSILADPRNFSVVEKINRAIKNRDFWMPFAPVILDKYWDKYLSNEKNIYSPYMTIGFETTKKGKNDLIAAIHPADKTTRPQMLIRESNPDYYDIINEFEKITGVGALLNTSFNLHGSPIIRTVEDAIHVFLNSELDALLLNNIYIEKKNV